MQYKSATQQQPIREPKLVTQSLNLLLKELNLIKRLSDLSHPFRGTGGSIAAPCRYHLLLQDLLHRLM